MKIYMNIKPRPDLGSHFHSFDLLDPNGQKFGGFSKCRLSNDVEKAQCFALANRIIQEKLNIKRHEYKLIHSLFEE